MTYHHCYFCKLVMSTYGVIWEKIPEFTEVVHFGGVHFSFSGQYQSITIVNDYIYTSDNYVGVSYICLILVNINLQSQQTLSFIYLMITVKIGEVWVHHSDGFQFQYLRQVFSKYVMYLLHTLVWYILNRTISSGCSK